MKHSFLLFLSLAAISAVAADRVVWTGNEPISWNTEVYAGTQFETPEGIFAGLLKDDTIKVNIIPQLAEPQYVITYKAGTDWTWTDITPAVADSLMTYVVTSDIIAEEIATRGLVFRGQGYDITCITVTDHPQDTTDVTPPDTTTIDLSGMYEKVVWTGTRQISWNTEEYSGDKLDTYVLQQDLLAGLAAGHVIAVAVQPDGEAQYCLQYKAGDDWTWTDLPSQLSTLNAQLYLVYRVADDDMAQLIADRGLVVSGIRYTATKISLFAASEWESALRDVNGGAFSGQRYNVLGQPVDAHYQGFVILNGKKMLVR